MKEVKVIGNMNEELKKGIIGEFTGISFSNKEELISIVMDNCLCQRKEALEVIDKVAVDSYCNGDISWEFFNEYISDNFKAALDKFNSIPLNICLNRISVVDEDGNVVTTTDFTDESKNLEVWKAIGL